MSYRRQYVYPPPRDYYGYDYSYYDRYYPPYDPYYHKQRRKVSPLVPPPPPPSRKKEIQKVSKQPEKVEPKKAKKQLDTKTKLQSYVFNFKPEEISRLPFAEKYEILMSWISFQEGANKERMEIFNDSYGNAMKTINSKIVEQELLKEKKG